MSTWRAAGLNYVNYSSIASQILRKSLKANLRDEAAKRDTPSVKFFFWVDGNMLPAGTKPNAPPDSGSGGGAAAAATGKT